MTDSQKILTFLLKNRNRKVDVEFLLSEFFLYTHDSKDVYKNKKIDDAKKLEGTTINRGGKDFLVEKFIGIDKKQGRKYSFKCLDCPTGTFDTFLGYLNKSSGLCDSCKEKKLGTKRIKAYKKRRKPLSENKTDPTITEQNRKNWGDCNKGGFLISDDLRGKWKEYSDEEYQKKLEEIKALYGGEE